MFLRFYLDSFKDLKVQHQYLETCYAVYAVLIYTT